MGILYGLTKMAGEGVDLYKGISGAVEQSRFKDFVKENPDWADNPDKMTEAISISPQLGMALVGQSKTVAEQRNARAAQRAVFMHKADEDAYKAYTQALERGTRGGESTLGETEEGFGAGDMEANYAAADKAGNDAYQRYRLQAADLYGEGFADKLPQVWKLSDPEDPLGGYEQRAPRTERMLDSMREPVNLVFPDGKKVTASLLPHELTKLTRENKGLQVEKLATSKAAEPPASKTLTPEKALDEEAKLRKQFIDLTEDARASNKMMRNILAAPEDGQGDLTLIYSMARMRDPLARTMTDSDIKVNASTGQFGDDIKNAVAQVTGTGRLDAGVRSSMVKSARSMYRQREEELGKAKTEYRRIAESAGVDADRVLVDLLNEVPEETAVAPAPAKPGKGLATTPDELGAALAVVRDPKAPLPNFKAALAKLPEGDLPSINRKALTDPQLAAYVAELKARKSRAKPPAKPAAAKGAK